MKMIILIIVLWISAILSLIFIKRLSIRRFLVISLFLVICLLYGQLGVIWGNTVATLDYSRVFSEIMNALYNSSKTNDIIVLQKQILYLNENFQKFTSENESCESIILGMENFKNKYSELK